MVAGDKPTPGFVCDRSLYFKLQKILFSEKEKLHYLLNAMAQILLIGAFKGDKVSVSIR